MKPSLSITFKDGREERFTLPDHIGAAIYSRGHDVLIVGWKDVDPEMKPYRYLWSDIRGFDAGA